MLAADQLSQFVFLGGDNDEAVEVWVVVLQGDIQNVIETDTRCDGFEAQVFGGRVGGRAGRLTHLMIMAEDLGQRQLAGWL